MKLSTRSRYGVRLVLDLALNYDRGPIRLGDIAKRQEIPLKYLEQIIIPLKKAEYVTSVRGPKGGHMLTRPPERITVGEIVALLEGGIKLTRCTAQPEICDRSATCITRFLWKEATEAIHDRLDMVTFARLVQMTSGREELLGCPAEGCEADDDLPGSPSETRLA
ncbi:MAG: Rrf2 family transcriptional regulator [Syntrophobacteraceae bacterium]